MGVWTEDNSGNSVWREEFPDTPAGQAAAQQSTSAGSYGSPQPGGGDGTQEYNAAFHQNNVAQANGAAQAEYQRGMLETGNQRLAFDRATQAWKEVMERASLTGMYEGQYTMPVQQWQAQQFGTWGAPTAGQRTLNAEEQAYTQWLRSAQEARINQTAQQGTAQNYLKLLSDLRGPADWAKYQQVLGATPGGMRDLASAAMGQYIPGGGATTGVQPQAANLQSMQQQIQGLGGGTNTMGAPANQMGNLPAQIEIAPQSWNNLSPSQRDLIMGQYEAQGWHKPDVESLLNQSLPKYATNAPTAGTFRLQ